MPSSANVRRDVVESRSLADIREQLLQPDLVAEVERQIRLLMKAKRPDGKQEVVKLQQEVDHLVAAIGQGLISAALRERLLRAEAELDRLQRAPKIPDIELLLPKLPALFRQRVA
jgi:hypothetical protein